jgi:hypothetical protein
MVNPHKDAAVAAAHRAAELRATGYTVFRFDFDRKFTRRDLSLGDAFRYLKKCTRFNVSFWRCPVRGLPLPDCLDCFHNQKTPTRSGNPPPALERLYFGGAPMQRRGDGERIKSQKFNQNQQRALRFNTRPSGAS